MTTTPLGAHVDVLGWLHGLWGLLGVLSGASLVLIAVGSVAAPRGPVAPAGPFYSMLGVLLVVGLSLTTAGLALMVVGQALRRRTRRGRTAALLLAGPNLLVLPFGTALGLYACWVLLNDDARQMFGRPLRSTPAA